MTPDPTIRSNLLHLCPIVALIKSLSVSHSVFVLMTRVRLVQPPLGRANLPPTSFSILMITCLCTFVSFAPVYRHLVSAAWLPCLLTQHGVVLKGAPWPLLITLGWVVLVPLLIFANTHWHSPLMSWGAAWTWGRPNKSNVILGWCVQACLWAPDNGAGQQGPALQLLCVLKYRPAWCPCWTWHVKDLMREGSVEWVQSIRRNSSDVVAEAVVASRGVKMVKVIFCICTKNNLWSSFHEWFWFVLLISAILMTSFS